MTSISCYLDNIIQQFALLAFSLFSSPGSDFSQVSAFPLHVCETLLSQKFGLCFEWTFNCCICIKTETHIIKAGERLQPSVCRRIRILVTICDECGRGGSPLGSSGGHPWLIGGSFSITAVKRSPRPPYYCLMTAPFSETAVVINACYTFSERVQSNTSHSPMLCLWAVRIVATYRCESFHWNGRSVLLYPSLWSVPRISRHRVRKGTGGCVKPAKHLFSIAFYIYSISIGLLFEPSILSGFTWSHIHFAFLLCLFPLFPGPLFSFSTHSNLNFGSPRMAAWMYNSFT